MITLILEGENKTGKTTLSKHIVSICEELKIPYSLNKFGVPDNNDPYIDYISAVHNISIKKNNKVNIFDRLYIGEMVYGKIYRGGSKLTRRQLVNIEMLASAKNGILIHCYDDAEKIKERFIKEKEEYAIVDNIQTTLDGFKNEVSKSSMIKLKHKINSKYDLTKTDTLKNLIVSYSNKRGFRTIIGNINSPKILIVGDKQEKTSNYSILKKYKKVRIPFDFGTDDDYLYNSLKLAKINLNTVSICNSDSPELHDYYHYYCKSNKPLVIALSNEADIVLNNYKIPHGKIPHPSSLQDKRINIYSELFKKIYYGSSSK